MRGGRGGGRGGRGGGRGGRGGGSATANLLRENMEEMDVAGGAVPGRSPPVLFPPIELNAPRVISEADDFLITKMRETTYRIKRSPYFISIKTEETDIARYSDKYRNNGKELSLLECINSGVGGEGQFIPQELLNGGVTGGRSSLQVSGEVDQLTRYQLKRKRDVDLQKLEQQEKAGGDGGRGAGEKKDDSDVEGEEEFNEDEFELEDDYGVDHYASGDDYSGGGDDEACF